MKICSEFHILTCVIVLTLSSNHQTYGQTVGGGSDPSLKLHFDFDENFSNGRVLDVSSNGNNGWQMDPTNWITTAGGVFGTTGAQFTYVGLIYTDPPNVHQYSQYIAVTNVNGFYYLTNSTISLWVRFDTNSDFSMYLLSAGYPDQYAADPTGASNSWTLNRDSSSYLNFVTYPNSLYKRDVVNWPDDTIQPGGYTPILATTKFHLYSITIDCPNNIAIAYYDGQPCMTNTIDLPWIRVYGDINLPWLCVGAMGHDGTPQWGDDAYPNAGFFVGKMDDLRIYNRTLSAAEVYDLYQGNSFARNLTLQPTEPQSVRLNWATSSNDVYQVEYETYLGTNNWGSLGLPIQGSGTTNSVIDSLVGQPSRFYRVRILP